MAPITIHRAETRGTADHGWLLSRHTFSFADYHDPERMGFGLLRVINDDIVAPGKGFDTHPHRNMEIISIPLQGALRHADSMGHNTVIPAGEIQLMSAGSGVSHSEYNASDHESVAFLQIWVYPATKNTEPRYFQKAFDPARRHNRFQLLVSPDGREESLVINQQAWFSMIDLQANTSAIYHLHGKHSGLYLFVLEGNVKAHGEALTKRDGMGISAESTVMLQASSATRILCMEVPMEALEA
ncbi:Pirin domain protein [Desulfurispirillum indicum S5]|uniref:Pirin domain protein n=1 Tax=Desulfurispirillum indicum (strain ATCC BAA-1389 / DSM 22839 / S5) TaxID=653733 RepID=E6W746_DESIS|nr:pirin family protein [Desulfurispirillum indicum]ADU65124.1 Pirin domain protein [Desulfurispirillum indicum S5]